MALTIKNPALTLSFAERGLLDYIRRRADANGLFRQHVDDIAHAGRVCHGTAHALQKTLIDGGYIDVIEPPRRGVRGKFATAVVLRLTGKSSDSPPSPRSLIDSVNVPKVDSVKMQQIDSVDVVEKPQASPSQPLQETTTNRLGKTEGRLTGAIEHITHSTEGRAVGNIANSTSVGVGADSVKNCVACTMLGKVGVPVARRGPNGYCQKHNNETCWLGEEE